MVEVFPLRGNLTLKWNSHRYLSDMTSENMKHGGRSEEQAKVPASADGFGWSGRTIFQGLKMLLKFWHVIITHRHNKQRSHPKIAYTPSMCVFLLLVSSLRWVWERYNMYCMLIRSSIFVPHFCACVANMFKLVSHKIWSKFLIFLLFSGCC